MRTAKALVIFNIGVVMALASMNEASRALDGGTSATAIVDILTFIVAWLALLGIPVAAIWGLATWKQARFCPALVVHPIALVLWTLTLTFTRA